MAVLLSSHLLTQVQSVCDRVGIFAAGRLVGVGTVEELASRFGEDTAHVEVGLEMSGDDADERREQLLRSIDGVDAVHRGERPRDPWILDVRPAEAAPRVRQQVLAAAAASGLELSSLRSVVPSLDDIYRRAVVRRGGSARVAA
jgi:ABC-2 type transport system ATP-binding protein